jgi:molecular chaperone GrpE
MLQGEPSPEELEAAQAANEADALAALAQAQGELAALQAKNTELADQYLRAQADVQNARRRADDEITKARKFAVEAFAESLLPVTDSLEAGLAIKDATPEQIREGAEATLRQLKSALERNKVIEVAPPAGTKFDPHQHQAISVVPADQEPNTVVTRAAEGLHHQRARAAPGAGDGQRAQVSNAKTRTPHTRFPQEIPASSP